MIPFPGKFSFVLSVSGYSDEEWLSFPEKTPPGAFLKAVRVSGKGTKESKEKKKGKKPAAERGSLPRKERTQAQTHGQYGYQKALKRFCLRASVKTATTYSPTCAVPSA